MSAARHPPKPRLDALHRRVTSCERCPRLRAHCREVARVKRASYRDETYWGRPVPGFGDPEARLLVVGLAPGAHGANRTGRLFTGDRSGDFLYAALHRAGFASQPESIARGDGLVLVDCYITAAARCAPPGNRPSREELDACRPFLREELGILGGVKAVLALGRVAHETWLRVLREEGFAVRAADAPFGHGAAHDVPDGRRLFDSFHPSQQNTFTGRLTAKDLDRVLAAVRRHLGG